MSLQRIINRTFRFGPRTDLFLVIGGMLLLQVWIGMAFGELALALLVIVDVLLLSMVFFLGFVKSVPTYLLLINLAPLMYLDKSLHYNYSWVLVQDIPFFLLIALAISEFIRKEARARIRLSDLNIPLVLFFLYFLFSAVMGLLRGFPPVRVADEFYHLSYYVASIFILYLLKDRRDYKLLFGFVIFIVIGVSAVYLYLFFWRAVPQIVTFQADLFPLAMAMLYAYVLTAKKWNVSRLTAIVLLFFIAAALVASLTRALWVSALLSIGVVTFFHFKKNHTLSYRKILLILVVAIPLLFLRVGKPSREAAYVPRGVENRAQSITNPGSDISFLMRVEIGYYALQKFMESPIVGKGLGDHVNFRILLSSRSEIYYPDNSWIFFLWKGGILGFSLVIWLFSRLLKQTHFLYTKLESMKVQALTLGLLGGMIAFLFNGLFSGTLMKYKYGIVFAIIFAYIEFERREVRHDG